MRLLQYYKYWISCNLRLKEKTKWEKNVEQTLNGYDLNMYMKKTECIWMMYMNQKMKEKNEKEISKWNDWWVQECMYTKLT